MVDSLPEPKSSWKPYVIGFLIGAVILTVIPFLQRRFLKAPPPVRQLPAWSVASLGGGEVSSAALAGKVVLATIEIAPCAAPCLERHQNFGTAAHHVDDLKGAIVLVSLVGPDAQPGLADLVKGATPAWRFGAAEAPFIAELQAALDQFRGATDMEISRSHAVVLIDQDNALRGFWPDDGAGRGNSINAARLLAKHGPNP